jgi:hypothetical protein
MSEGGSGRIVRVEKRVRGVGGQIAKWVFIGFNVLMLIWLVGGMISAGQVVNSAQTDAEQAGAAVGTAIGVTFILMIWVFGDIILGLIALLTRGKKIIIEEPAP